MADFVVDYAVLQRVESALNHLKNEFAGINVVPPGAAGWGDSGIASAMSDFHTNWSHHRDQLVQSMEAMISHARDTRTGTEDWDTKNQRGLTKGK